MTSGTGNTTLLHAYIHLRNQQAFQRAIAQVSSVQYDTGIVLATSPKSPRSKQRNKDKDDVLDVNARDPLGRTALHLAASMTEPSAVEYVRMLLKCTSVNVNLPDRESAWTALHRAMYIGNLAVILLLLQHPSTDPSLKDYEGYTAFDLYNSTVEGTRPSVGTFIAPGTSSKGAELFTWGTNRNASLGHGDTSDRNFPDHVSVPRPFPLNTHEDSTSTPIHLRFAKPGVRQVKMGRLHTGVISTFPKYSTARAKETDTGTISGVSLSGFGSGGRLGQTQHTQYALRPLAFSGTSSSTVTGNQMPGSTLSQGQGRVKITSIALGQDHTLALTADGEVFSWGLNRFAQLGYVVEREESGMGAGAHSATFGDDEFVAGVGTGEQIQLTPRRVYGALKKEYVVGIAASKSASVCWIRSTPTTTTTGGDGGNVYTWGLNSGQLGYERTGIGSQLQILPRKVTKITKPVVQIALGESAMVCLLGGTGAASGKGDVLIVWGDRVTRVNFPTHTFPSSISPYRPPQALKSTRIVKIVASDEAPPAWTTNTLSMLTSGSSTPVQVQSSSSGSQLSRMMSAMSTNETSSFGSGGTNMNQVHFACVSEGGEVFVFGVPGAPPVGTFGGASDGADPTTSSGTRLETLVTSKLFKPQRVWGLKRGLVGAVRDVAIGAEGSLIVCTDSGHVYVRSRSNVVTAFDSASGVSTSKVSTAIRGADTTSGGKSQKFVRVPSLQRIVGVCASSTGAFGALRVDVDVEGVIKEKETLQHKKGDGKGWDLVRDMKNARPWMWVRDIKSALDKEKQRERRMKEADPVDVVQMYEEGERGKDTVLMKEKDDLEEEEDDDKEIQRDVETLKGMCHVLSGVFEKEESALVTPESRWEEKGRLPYGADLMVSVLSSSTPGTSAGQKKKGKAKTLTMPGGLADERQSSNIKPTTAARAKRSFSIPVHQVFLASRSKVLCTALSSSAKEEVLRDPSSGISIRLFSSPKAQRQIEFSHVHPLTVLVLLEYLYTDELVAVWDRRVARVLDSSSFGHGPTAIAKELKLSMALAPQIKTELQALGRILDLQEMLRGMESSVKKSVTDTLRKDLEGLFWEKHNLRLSESFTTDTARTQDDEALRPDVVLMLAEDKEVYMHSSLLRARSVYFEDFLGEEAWTRNRWTKEEGDDGHLILKVDMKHVRWQVMQFVASWMCCGVEEGLFGALEFASSVDEVLEFLFEVIGVANELLLSPLILLTSSLILKFLHVSNACYILTQASLYHAYPLVNSVSSYIARNLETFLESRHGLGLDELTPAIIKQLSVFIREKQEEKATFVRGGILVDRAMGTWKTWLEEQDVPSVIVPSQKRERRVSGQAHKMSPSEFSMTVLGKQKEREVSVNAQGSPVLKPRKSSSPILKPKTSSSPVIKSIPEDIFDMDDVDIGPPSIPADKPSTPGPAWKTPSVPRVDMRALMAEAANTSPAPIGTYIPPRGSPGTSLNSDTTPFNSMRIRQKSSAQRSVSGLFEAQGGPSTPPRERSSPWKTTTTQSPGAKETSAPMSVKTKDSPGPVPGGIARTPSGQGQTNPNLGPVFTPTRQPSSGISSSKPNPGLPRRVSSNTSTNKSAWTSTPIQEPIVESTAGMSFAAIQQLQLEQGSAGNAKDKKGRSLLQIQQEEKERREEEEFLKWWEQEEERVRLETEEAMRLSVEETNKKGGGKAARGGQRPRKPRAAKAQGSAHTGENAGANAGANVSAAGAGKKRGSKPKGKALPPES